MGFLDTILGRTKPVRPDLDALFSLPSAAVTLQAASGLVPTGRAGVCFKPPAGRDFAEVQQEIEQLLATADSSIGATGASAQDDGSGSAAGPAGAVHDVPDRYGYRWVVFDGGGIDDLVTRVHLVHSSIEDAGWGPQLLCSVFAFRPGNDADTSDMIREPVYLVYLAKRGTFYPFAPSGHEQRDSELELRVRSLLGSDLPVEADISRWFPVWELPIA
jgi:hypothetical protein